MVVALLKLLKSFFEIFLIFRILNIAAVCAMSAAAFVSGFYAWIFELLSLQILNNNLKKYMPTYICSTEINIRILHYICPKMTFSSEFLKTFFLCWKLDWRQKRSFIYTLQRFSQNDLLDIRLSKKSSK